MILPPYQPTTEPANRQLIVEGVSHFLRLNQFGALWHTQNPVHLPDDGEGTACGGALTMYTAALDDRVKVALVNSYLGKYVVTCLDEKHCPCNDIPGILRYAEMGDVAALIAPRPVMFVNGRRDPSTGPAARGSFAIVRQVYRILGVPQRAKLIEPEEMGHAFDNQLAIGWFRRWLVGRENQES
ncbi:MAG: hypothetical protein J7M17_01555 [Anaerolineae bacterium]|nr:hypothetical protein [Anaerolineae bacterium]